MIAGGRQEEQSKGPAEKKAGPRWDRAGSCRWVGSREALQARPIEDRERAVQRAERARVCQLLFAYWLPLREDAEARRGGEG